ncbi:MAG: hypothetical protein K2W95_34080 [Candidatus Obscuribacterales bacterium]|nr:hypothetical protein [Candidatus Obscuribacterales bacterium]
MNVLAFFILLFELINRSCRKYGLKFAGITTIIVVTTGGIAELSGGAFGIAALYALAACIGLVTLVLSLLAAWIVATGFR